jgi:hypothetical protein
METGIPAIRSDNTARLNITFAEQQAIDAQAYLLKFC